MQKDFTDRLSALHTAIDGAYDSFYHVRRWISWDDEMANYGVDDEYMHERLDIIRESLNTIMSAINDIARDTVRYRAAVDNGVGRLGAYVKPDPDLY